MQAFTSQWRKAISLKLLSVDDISGLNNKALLYLVKKLSKYVAAATEKIGGKERARRERISLNHVYPKF